MKGTGNTYPFVDCDPRGVRCPGVLAHCHRMRAVVDAVSVACSWHFCKASVCVRKDGESKEVEERNEGKLSLPLCPRDGVRRSDARPTDGNRIKDYETEG